MKRILLALALACTVGTHLQAQIFVSNDSANVYEYSDTGSLLKTIAIGGGSNDVYLDGSNTLLISNYGTTSIQAYNITTGTLTTFVNGTFANNGMDIIGGTLYLSDTSTGTINSYNATTGAAISTSLISGLNNPTGVAVSTSDIYVAQQNLNEISEYTLTGTLVKANFITGITNLNEITISGDTLYVSGGNGVGTYNATTGAAIDASFANDGTGPIGNTLGNGDLYLANYTAGDISEFNGTTGALINANFISGLTHAAGITSLQSDIVTPGDTMAAAAPEPAAWTLALLVLGAFLWLYQTRIKGEGFDAFSL